MEALNKAADQKSLDLRSPADMILCPYERIPNRKCIERACSNCEKIVLNMYNPLVEINSKDYTLSHHQ